MTQFTTTTERLWVASDVAKRAHEVLVLWPGCNTRSFRVPNTSDEFQRLAQCKSDLLVTELGYLHGKRALRWIWHYAGFLYFSSAPFAGGKVTASIAPQRVLAQDNPRPSHPLRRGTWIEAGRAERFGAIAGDQCR